MRPIQPNEGLTEIKRALERHGVTAMVVAPEGRLLVPYPRIQGILHWLPAGSMLFLTPPRSDD